MGSPRTVIVLLLGVVCLGAVASAQEARRGYAQGAFVFTFQEPSDTNHRVSPGVSGMAVGVSGVGGFFVTPTVAVEGEVLLPGTVSTEQTFTYTNMRDTWTTEVDGVCLHGNVRWRPRRYPRLDVVGGVGMAYTRVAFVNRINRNPYLGTSSSAPDTESTDTRPSVSMGVDVTLLRRPSGRLIGGVRFRILPQGPIDEYNGVGYFAMAATVGWRFGR